MKSMARDIEKGIELSGWVSSQQMEKDWQDQKDCSSLSSLLPSAQSGSRSPTGGEDRLLFPRAKKYNMWA